MKEKKQKPITRPRGPRRLARIFFQRFLVVLLILLQFALWFIVPMTSAAAYQWVDAFFRVVGIVCTLFVIADPTPAAYRLLWTVLLLLVPVPGVVLFLLLRGRRASSSLYRYARRAGRHEKIQPLDKPYNAGHYSRCVSYLASHGFSAESAEGSLYFPLGEYNFAKMIEELSHAEKYVFMEYFIIDDGELWDKILDILREKAEKGVEIRILMDDIGCFMRRPRGYAESLRKMGFKVRIFNTFTPFITATQNYRDH